MTHIYHLKLKALIKTLAKLHTASVKVKGNTYNTTLLVISAPTHILCQKQPVVLPCLDATRSYDLKCIV